MDEPKIKEIISAVKAIDVGLLAMQASGYYKLRQNIKLTDKELREYFDSTKSNIYTAIISNLVLQDIFSKEITKPAFIKKFNEQCKHIQDILEKTGIGGGLDV